MPMTELQLIRDENCILCKLHQTGSPICELGKGNAKAKIMVVSKMGNSREWQKELLEDLVDVGLNPKDIYFTQAIKCRTFDQNPSNADVKKCRVYLDQEIELVKPKWILALGNEALLATTGKSGITKYRGRIYEGPKGTKIVPTISPSSVKRNPGQRGGYMADLTLFANKVSGRGQGIDPPNYMVVDTKAKLRKLKEILAKTVEIDYDVETFGEYYKPDGRIISFSATCEVKTALGMRTFVFALPLYHPESPWLRMHRSVLQALKPELEAIPKVVAHNGGYDAKWMITYGIMLKPTFDTMLAIHVLNENIQKGLKPQAQMRLGVEPWGVDTSNLLTMPLEDVLHYNVLDTWYMYHVKRTLVKELKEKPRQARVLMKLLMPALRDLIDSEMLGIYTDVDRLKKRGPYIHEQLLSVENRIRIAADLQCDDNPGGLREDDSEWPKDAKGKPRETNFNASIFARWMLFEWCGLPVLARGKTKDDGRPGDPSMAEDVLMALTEHHKVVPIMLERVKWQKYESGFINPYNNLYDEDHRIHTNFKLAGTVTGRLSSGKDDPDKVSTGGRGKRQGVNLQQVPRDPLIRGIFGSAPGWYFVEADYSQIELRIAAFLAQEDHMLHLYNIGADIHLATAARVTGLPESKVTSEIRKKVGKPVNFGFLYGMGWYKFIQTAFSNYGATFDQDEAKAARRTYFELFPKLIPWHAKQRRLVNEYGRVQSPLGRVRHLPDIYSPEEGVRAEAERQAINSPVQGFASDLAVLSMVEINRQIRKRGLAARCIGLVHDAINFEIREDAMSEVLPIIKDTMEDMSIVRRKFGVHVGVPIVADLKVGRHWGDSKELSPDHVYDWKAEYAGE